MSGSPTKAHDGQPRPHGVVAFDAGSLAGGGAERSTLLVATNWPDGPLRARLMLGVRSGPYVTDIPLDLGVDEVGSTRYLALPMFFLRVRRAIRRHRIVAIAAFDRRARVLIAARCVGLIPRRAIVVVEHNTVSSILSDRYPSSIARRWQILIRRWLYRRADAIIAVSDGVARDLEETLRLSPGTVVTIYNPLDSDAIGRSVTTTTPSDLTRRFDRLPRPVLITAGRLVHQKGQRHLLEAFAMLPSHLRGSLVILGDGLLRESLESHAEHLGISEQLWMPGFIEDPWWFISRSDLFCLPSLHEGHPIALLEAAACKVPIVATDCPSGPLEILGDSPGTRLTPVADSRRLADAISELLGDPVRPDVDLSAYAPASVAARYVKVIVEASAPTGMKTAQG